MNNNKNADDLRHDTMLLLRKYRQVKWALEVSSKQALRELQERTGGTLDVYLHAAVFAGADISNTALEGRAQSMERSRKMISLIEDSICFMRRNHPRGEIYYQILYHCYMTPQELSVEGVLNAIDRSGYPLCDKTFRKYRREAIRIVGEILWGYDDRESTKILREILEEK